MNLVPENLRQPASGGGTNKITLNTFEKRNAHTYCEICQLLVRGWVC